MAAAFPVLAVIKSPNLGCCSGVIMVRLAVHATDRPGRWQGVRRFRGPQTMHRDAAVRGAVGTRPVAVSAGSVPRAGVR
jgi:hypothetical protein